MTGKGSAKRTTRLVYGAFVVVVALFVVSNIWQVSRRVFGTHSADTPPAENVGAACGAALDAEIKDIDRARLAASTEPTGAAARTRYASERKHKIAIATTDCEADANGLEALAALARLDRAAEAHAVRESSELSPVRLAAQSFIRGPNR